MRDAGGGGGLRRRRRADDALGAAVAHAAARAAGVRRAAPAGPPTASVRGECRAAARAAVTRPVQGVQGGDESHSRGWRPARPAWQGPCGWCKALNVTMCWTFSAMHQRDNERYRQRERQSETEQEIVRESERQSEAERERGRYATRGDKHIAAAGVHTVASALTPAPPPPAHAAGWGAVRSAGPAAGVWRLAAAPAPAPAAAAAAAAGDRTTPRWPRSWANFSLLDLYSRRHARANSHLLG